MKSFNLSIEIICQRRIWFHGFIGLLRIILPITNYLTGLVFTLTQFLQSKQQRVKNLFFHTVLDLNALCSAFFRSKSLHFMGELQLEVIK